MSNMDRQVRKAHTELRSALTRAQYACETEGDRDAALAHIARARRISDMVIEMTQSIGPGRDWDWWRKQLDDDQTRDTNEDAPANPRDGLPPDS